MTLMGKTTKKTPKQQNQSERPRQPFVYPGLPGALAVAVAEDGTRLPDDQERALIEQARAKAFDQMRQDNMVKVCQRAMSVCQELTRVVRDDAALQREINGLVQDASVLKRLDVQAAKNDADVAARNAFEEMARQISPILQGGADAKVGSSK